MPVMEVEPFHLDDLCTRLRRNEIEELKLGWKESNFILGRRSSVLLQRALKANSSVESVSVGWRHKSRPAQARVLKVIAENTRLKHLRLVLNDWLPDFCLFGLLGKQQSLETVDLRSVQVKSVDATGRPCCDDKESAVTEHKKKECDHDVVGRIVVQLHHHQNLKALRLIDCGIDSAKANILSNFLHIRGGISELSLRSNRELGPAGIRVICQAPVMHRLDLSLCDMGTAEARELGASIPKRPWPLGELLLCGNYRMGQEALLGLVQQACCDKIVKLNTSYCDVSDHIFTLMMQALERIQQPTALQEICLQGSIVGKGHATDALARLLVKEDCALRTIRIDDPQMPKYVTPAQLSSILGALKTNYEIEELRVDFLKHREELAVWKQIDFQLRLNRAGRRILCRDKIQSLPRYNENSMLIKDTDDWFDVIAQTNNDDDMDVLFWLIRESAGHFDRQARL